MGFVAGLFGAKVGGAVGTLLIPVLGPSAPYIGAKVGGLIGASYTERPTDIHGNDSNTNIHGNPSDGNIHGNVPTDGHGNSWDLNFF